MSGGAGFIRAMDDPTSMATTYLLITRTGGKSASRYQRRFTTRTEVDRAVRRRRAAGASAFWIYGPAPPEDQWRPLLEHWTLTEAH